MSRISTRGAVDPFLVMEVLAAAKARAAAGWSVLHLEVGQPGAGAPRAAVEAAAAAMRAGPLGYTEALGLPALRARIARRYGERHGIDLDPARVAVTVGASGGFLLAFLALFDAGARVGVVEPGYPAYRNILRALDLVPVPLVADPAAGFAPTPALVAGAAPLDGLLVASPANPTGGVLDRGALAALAQAARAQGAAFVSDEIYHGIEFGPPAPSALEVDDGALVVNSFSKYFAMTGWRIGWIVVPPALVATVDRLAQNLFICPPHVAQVAALAALDAGEELDGHVAAYARSRAVLLDALPRAGFGAVAASGGAFYLYADAAPLTDDSVAFCARMLAETGVAATPGVDFDPARGRAWVRFSVAAAEADVAEAARRLVAWRP